MVVSRKRERIETRSHEDAKARSFFVSRKARKGAKEQRRKDAKTQRVTMLRDLFSHFDDW